MADKLSELQLEAIVAQQIELAKTHDRTERATARDKALDYYFGRMDKYVPPEPNRSKVVSRDVADTIGWLMPEIMKVFTASGRMFVAEPEDEEDLEVADDATEGMNYIFWKDNKGYEVVYAATWDSLLHGDGIVKTYWDHNPVYGPARFHEGLSEDQRAMVAEDDNAEVMASTERTQPVPDQNPEMTAAGYPDVSTGQTETVYDMKIRHKKADGRITIDCIPPEDFLIDADAISLEDAAFKSHWQRKTRSELIEMGYDKDTIWAIPEAARNETAEVQARRMFISADATDKSMQLVDYHECFVQVDVDGDGVAEMVRVCYAGPGGQSKGALLDWEVWEDEDPFDNIPCEPIPHRWDSRSIADEEIDIQDVKTVLTRQLLNNTYWVNNPQRLATGKIKNPEALDSPVFGQTVFADSAANVVDLPVPYIGDKALQGINYMDEVSARRTGVNSQSMAIDPEVLQNQSATANQNAVDASRSQPELIARNMAEIGWKKVGRKILRLMNRHQTEARTILVKGKPVQIDPKNWNPDMHINVNTGLGTGSRAKDAMMLGQILQQQILYTDRIAQAFPGKALDMLPFIHNTLTKFVESMGSQNPELYWPEIDDNEIAQGKQMLDQKAQQPDPKIQADMAKAQADQQGKQAEMQANMQLEQARLQITTQIEQMKSEAQVKREAAQLQADLQTKEADRQSAMLIEQQRQQFEWQKFQAELQVRMAELEQTKEIEMLKISAQQANAEAARQDKAEAAIDAGA